MANSYEFTFKLNEKWMNSYSIVQSVFALVTVMFGQSSHMFFNNSHGTN